MFLVLFMLISKVLAYTYYGIGCFTNGVNYKNLYKSVDNYKRIYDGECHENNICSVMLNEFVPISKNRYDCEINKNSDECNECSKINIPKNMHCDNVIRKGKCDTFLYFKCGECKYQNTSLTCYASNGGYTFDICVLFPDYYTCIN